MAYPSSDLMLDRILTSLANSVVATRCCSLDVASASEHESDVETFA